jgi:CAAX protease family protein
LTKAWGYWATLGWALLAFAAGQLVALAAIVVWRAGALSSLLETPYDGRFITLFLFISTPITMAVLALAVRLARERFAEYMALSWPPTRDVALGILWLIGLIAGGDAWLYVSGRPLVTPFQAQSYATAAAEGWLFPMFAAAILVAPVGEELIFRGFLFRGWARSIRSTWPAIVVISLLWAALHVQYDWTGILQIFVIGLFLGAVRWRSGSTLLTFVLHALFNLEGTIETALQLRFS